LVDFQCIHKVDILDIDKQGEFETYEGEGVDIRLVLVEPRPELLGLDRFEHFRCKVPFAVFIHQGSLVLVEPSHVLYMVELELDFFFGDYNLIFNLNTLNQDILRSDIAMADAELVEMLKCKR
jgi:hypothetical protein